MTSGEDVYVPDEIVPGWLVVDVECPRSFDASLAYRAGARVVELSQPINLEKPTPTDIHALDIVKRATAQGFSVLWALRKLRHSMEIAPLSHLHPPDRIEQPGAATGLDAWWKSFYLGRCCWRQGPGFVQIRDRRRGALAKYTITGPDLTSAWYALDSGQQTLSPAVARLVDAGLILSFGELAWLAPYRLVRWPTPNGQV